MAGSPFEEPQFQEECSLLGEHFFFEQSEFRNKLAEGFAGFGLRAREAIYVTGSEQPASTRPDKKRASSVIGSLTPVCALIIFMSWSRRRRSHRATSQEPAHKSR
jgi:hypothetical protein